MGKAESTQKFLQVYLPLILGAASLAWMVSLCLRSNGLPVQDEIGHYNLSRQAWYLPELILDQWGRPANTLLYLLPARVSWLAARLLSILISVGGVCITWLVARFWKLQYAWLIPLVLFFQPWYSSLGFTVITEVPFSLLIIAGLYLALKDRGDLASVCFGLLPLIRHEGMLLLGFWVVYLLFYKRFRMVILSLIPYAVYATFFFLITGDSSFAIFLDPSPTDFYGRGDWLHYLTITYQQSGRLPLVLSILGIPLFFRNKPKSILLLLYPLYFLLHTVIYRFGLYASGGYDLFLLPLAPGIALGSVAGLEILLGWIQKNRMVAKWPFIHKPIHVIVLAGSAVYMLITGLQIQPHHLTVEESSIGLVSDYLASRHVNPTRVYSTHQYFIYRYDLPYQNWLYHPDLSALKAGSMIVWDAHYSERWGVNAETLAATSSDYRILYASDNGLVILFEKLE
jgi:hypothetical protein